MGFKGTNSPIASNIKNPLKKGDKSKLKAHHENNLRTAGVKSPRSPLF